MDQTADPRVLQRALDRERKRRAIAESLLEEKSRELYQSYTDLEDAHNALKDAQDKMIQTEKMASLGMMSAGIAHEINNPIGFVHSNITTMNEYLEIFREAMRRANEAVAGQPHDAAQAFLTFTDDEGIADLFDDAQDIMVECNDGLHRVQEIVASLKLFSRQENTNTKPTDINQVIEESLAMILRHKPDNVEVSFEPSPTPSHLRNFRQTRSSLRKLDYECDPGHSRLWWTDPHQIAHGR